MIGGGSYEAQVPTEVHAGLGDATSADVEVRWPGAAEVQRIEGVGADQVLTVRRDR